MHLAIMVETRWRDDTAIARCRGPVLFGPTSRHLRTSVGRLILRHRRVILHLGGVTRFDACGVGKLAALIRLAQWSGGRLLLATPSDRVRYLLVLTRLDTQVEYVIGDDWCPGRARTAEAEPTAAVRAAVGGT